jgi:arylsulfatase A
LKTLLSVVTFLLVASAFVRAEDSLPLRPNILYLYVDDMGWGSIGPNGQSARRAQGLPALQTPNLDRLAAQGLNFSRAYGCTVCSPARSSQQTGFHQGHTFADRNDPDNAKKAIRTADLTMGDVLSKAGYVTGYWGKWGYGGSADQQAPTLDNLQTLPPAHGYHYVLAELHHVRAHTFFQPTLWKAPARPGSIGGLELVPNSLSSIAGNSRYPTTPALQNHPDYPATAYCDDSYAFAALDFVRKQAQNYRATGQPFFGLFAAQVPHAPFGEIATLPAWDAAYRDQPDLSPEARQWAAMVTRIDGHLGNLLAALEDPNGDGDTSDSVAHNTLIVFQSDNGGPQHNARDEFAANGALRGQKGQIYEGGIRIPTIIRWPGLAAGTTTDRLLDVTDLLPTFCELAGVPSPLGIDGVSIAPLLRNSGAPRPRNFLIHEAHPRQSIIRGRYKLIRDEKSPLELYDLATDPNETTDIAAKHSALVTDLAKLLLDERVAEPRGFANTYHHWTGANGATTSDAANWSDYHYANAGITYQTDEGAPQLSWIAQLHNSGSTPATARADQHLEFLALEISGEAEQHLVLDPHVNLLGRNEIRLSRNAKLTLQGGTVSSLRWIELKAGATLAGHGTLGSDLFTQGTMAVSRAGLLHITGTANLGGSLTVPAAERVQSGDRIPVLQARTIRGKFDKIDDRFIAEYTPTSVTLVAK